MNNEEVILKEANEFFKNKIDSSHKVQAIDDFHEIKIRLLDFYSDENKSIFLNEVARLISESLQSHRNKSHAGMPGVDCAKEKKPEALLFYIKQELDNLPTLAHQKQNIIKSLQRNKVFISYSQLDKIYLSDIQRHFKPFLTQINLWDDTRITPGQKWKDEIKKAIDETKVAILLVSTNFLGSDFISSNELPPLLNAAEESGAVILMVILEPCLIEEFESLNQYQAMNKPGRSVVKMEYAEKEELYVNLVRQTKRILENK